MTGRSVDIGDEFIVQKGGGVEVQELEDEPKYIQIRNKGKSITAGYAMLPMLNETELGESKIQSVKCNPICAISMPGDSIGRITPKRKLLVSFSTSNEKETGVCVVEVETASATIEYFGQIAEHSIKYDFDSGKWKKHEAAHLLQGGWFSAIKAGAGLLNKVLNG